MTTTLSLKDLEVSLDDVLSAEDFKKYSKNNTTISIKVSKKVVAAAAAGTIFTTAMININSNNEPYNVLVNPITETVAETPNGIDVVFVNDRTNTTTYYTLEPVTLSADVKDELADSWAEIPQSVKESNVLKGVVIENKEQLEALKSKEIVYSNEVLPIQVIQNGKADVSEAVRSFEPLIRAELQKYDAENLTEFLLALLQQESGGSAEVLGSDPFQSSQSKNEIIGSITDPSESVAQGVSAFMEKIDLNNMEDPLEHGDVRTAIQSYNFGGRISRIAEENNYGYSMKYIQDQSESLAVEYNKPINTDWRGVYAYGDFTYVPKIFKYFTPQADWAVKAQQAAAVVLEEQAAQQQAEKEKEVLVEETNETTIAKPTTSSSEEEIFAYEQELYKDKIASINTYFSKVQVAAPASSNALKGKVIMVDAGHGGNDVGALSIDKTIKEADINLVVAKLLKKNLESQGATVIMTRSSAGEFMEVHERGKLAKNQGADMLISIHANSFSNENKTYDYIPSGVETFKGLGTGSQAFANTVHSHIADAFNMIDDRGVKDGSNLGVLRNATDSVDTLLVELGFVKSPVDGAILTNTNAQATVANAIANGVVEYAGETVEEAPTPTPPAEDKEVIEFDDSKQESTETEQPEVETPVEDESTDTESDETVDEEVSENEDTENDKEVEENETTEDSNEEVGNETPSDEQETAEENQEEVVQEQKESVAERLLRLFSVDD